MAQDPERRRQYLRYTGRLFGFTRTMYFGERIGVVDVGENGQGFARPKVWPR